MATEETKPTEEIRQQRIRDGMREIKALSEYISNDVDLDLNIDQKLALTRKLLDLCLVLDPGPA